MIHELERTEEPFTLRARIVTHEFCDTFAVYRDRAYMAFQIVLVTNRVDGRYRGQIARIVPEHRPWIEEFDELEASTGYEAVIGLLPEPL